MLPTNIERPAPSGHLGYSPVRQVKQAQALDSMEPEVAADASHHTIGTLDIPLVGSVVVGKAAAGIEVVAGIVADTPNNHLAVGILAASGYIDHIQLVVSVRDADHSSLGLGRYSRKEV